MKASRLSVCVLCEYVGGCRASGERDNYEEWENGAYVLENRKRCPLKGLLITQY